MLYKRYLKQWWFLLKASKKTVFVPVFFVYIFVPLLNFAAYRNYGISDGLYQNIVIYTQTLIPYFSTWWSMMSLKEFAEGDGAEVLIAGTKKLHIFYIFNYILYAVMIIVPFAVYAALFHDLIFLYFEMLIECAMFNAISYALMFGVKSLITAVTLPVMYTIYSFFCTTRGGMINMSYISFSDPTQQLLLDKYVPILIVSVLVIAVISVINKKFYRYMQ